MTKSLRKTQGEAPLAEIEPRIEEGPSHRLLRQMIATNTLRKAREERAHLMRITKGPLSDLKGKRKLKASEQEIVDRVMAAVEVGMDPGDILLGVNDGVEVRRSSQKNERGVRRLDAFDLIELLKDERNAVRRLEGDMLTRRGEDDRGASLSLVDGSTGRCRQDRMLEASDRVTNALKRIGGRDAFLLTELIYPGIPGEQWRMTVLRVTKEINPVSQATVIRSACANLAAAYGEIDR